MSMQDVSTTIVGMFQDRVSRDARKTALYVRRGGCYTPRSWSEVAEDAGRGAVALRQLGVAPGDRVALVSPNRPEWALADLAIHLAGGVSVPIHASLSCTQIEFQITDCDAKALILSGPEQVEKLAPLARRWPRERAVIVFGDGHETSDFELRRWSHLLGSVDVLDADRALNQAAQRARGDDLATILYTSGTTGEPKGVMLTQHNLASNAQTCAKVLGHRSDDLRLTWLPLSHIFARTCDLYTWIAAGCQWALADSPETVLHNCAEIKPTLLNGVPYFFEKVQRALVAEGLERTEGSLRARFGGRLRSCIGGGAPVPEHVIAFYEQQGIRLLQGYGLTETSPVIAVETGAERRLGSVGRPIPEVEVRIAPDGEILTRGPHVMRGYWNRPEETSRAIVEGWFHTGDLGTLDSDGFLKITGRKKELIVTSGGKNVAPAFLESLIKSDPLVAQVMVVGDRQAFLAALVVPDFGVLAQTLAREGIEPIEPARAVYDARVVELFQRRIAELLKDVSRYEQIGQITLLAKPFSVEAGELTPTLKLRRNVIATRYAATIDAMYARQKHDPAC